MLHYLRFIWPNSVIWCACFQHQWACSKINKTSEPTTTEYVIILLKMYVSQSTSDYHDRSSCISNRSWSSLVTAAAVSSVITFDMLPMSPISSSRKSSSADNLSDNGSTFPLTPGDALDLDQASSHTRVSAQILPCCWKTSSSAIACDRLTALTMKFIYMDPPTKNDFKKQHAIITDLHLNFIQTVT